jgi:2-amino-4-hydroxy-6-hydroxymethyldihydropteridine diphosphokinase
MILIGIGANLPGPDGAAPLATARAAAAALDAIPGLRLEALSRWWESAPIPPDPAAPWFVNGVARLSGEIEPRALLAALQAIEARHGRERPYPNAPRSLDLDLLDASGALSDDPALTLPHPRLHLRRFVLAPLAEVAQGWRHARLGASVEQLLDSLPPQELRPVPLA